MFGFSQLFRSQAIVAALPASLVPAGRLLIVACNYLIIVAGTLAFLELTLGVLRRFVQVQLIAGVAIALGGTRCYLTNRPQNAFLLLNLWLAPVLLAALVVTLCVPALSRRFLVLARHRVLTVGTLIFSAEAL
jgi:hypothetical protein